MAFSVHAIAGLKYDHYHRGVVFLRCDNNPQVNAEAVFNALKQNDQNRMRDKFESWMRGNNGPSEWFHGFDDGGRKYCFVFKRKKGHTRYRYYGFLINPQPNTDPGYRLCVLTNHAQKNVEATDPSETNFADALRVNADVIAAVKKSFTDK
jgi:hypothetical protein